MPQDRLMAASEVDRMLAAAQQQEAQRQQAQQMLGMVLRQTLEQPQRITTLTSALVGVRFEDEQAVLSVATPTGERVDVPMPRQVLAKIAQHIVDQEAKLAAAETPSDVESRVELP